MAITFQFKKNFPLTNRRKLKDFITSLLLKNKREVGNIVFIFCTDEYLLEINKKFLKHDYYTDIITFDISLPGSNIVDAEILISVDRVKDNSIQYDELVIKEMHRVIFHGILHLIGYNDKNDIEEKNMR